MSFRKVVSTCALALSMVVLGTGTAFSEENTDRGALKFTPYVSFSTGYDTNPDEEDGGRGSGLYRGDVGLEIAYETEKTEAVFEVEAKYAGYPELSDWLDEEITVSFDLERELTNRFDFKLGTEYEHADDLGSKTVDYSGYLGLVYESDFLLSAQKLSVERSLNLGGSDDLQFEHPKRLNYVKTSGSSVTRIMRKNRIAPFMKSRLAYADYTNQDVAVIDRDAVDQSLVLGVTLTLTPKLIVDLGGRYNLRKLDNHALNNIDRGFVDINLTWNPTDDFELEAGIHRTMEEPSVDLSVVEDTITYEASIETKLNSRLSLELEASFEDIDKIGSGELSKEWELEAALFYNLTTEWRMFGKFNQGWTTDKYRTTGVKETYDRTAVRIGFESQF